MKVILDEGVPRQVVDFLPNHEVTTVPDAGWASAKNGKLVSLIEEAGYHAFITCDKAMETQQPFDQLPFAILLLSTKHFPSMKAHASAIASALKLAGTGVITKVECGRFIARKFRTPAEPPDRFSVRHHRDLPSPSANLVIPNEVKNLLLLSPSQLPFFLSLLKRNLPLRLQPSSLYACYVSTGRLRVFQ